MTAETIIINTGAVPTILPIPGLAESKGLQWIQPVFNVWKIYLNAWVSLVVDQSGWNCPSLQYLGSQVTVLDASEAFLPRIEPSIAALAKGYLEEDGIQFLQAFTPRNQRW